MRKVEMRRNERNKGEGKIFFIEYQLINVKRMRALEKLPFHNTKSTDSGKGY